MSITNDKKNLHQIGGDLKFPSVVAFVFIWRKEGRDKTAKLTGIRL